MKHGHKVHPVIFEKTTPITVSLIGAGGTGSHMLANLAKIHLSLKALGHQGLYVSLWDDDIVSPANVGRQAFSPNDIGNFKAAVLITKINRFFNLQWESNSRRFTENDKKTNIVITATDSLASRKIFKQSLSVHNDHYAWNEHLYWLDCGNGKKNGQVILGSSFWGNPKLPNLFDLFPDLLESDFPEDDSPSCSIAASLNKQDLFINPIVASMGAQILWSLFRQPVIEYHGAFINLETLKTNPIKAIPLKEKEDKTKTKSKRTAEANR